MGKRFFLLFVSPILVVTLFVFYDKTIARDESAFRDGQVLAQARRLILSQYVEPVEERQLLLGALRGMVDTLDGYSAYLDPESRAQMRISTDGEFGGLGIEVGVRDGWLTVITPIEGTPAHEAGILPGDRIEQIEGESTEKMTLQDATKRLRGAPGTSITITVRSKGDESPRDVAITRAVIRIQSVRRAGFVDLDRRVGYMALTGFQKSTAEEVEKAFRGLEADGMKALVLDLRGNPGGLFDSAVDVADLFLDEGVIVATRGRAEDSERVEEATVDLTLSFLPMAVLIDDGSASASEILAGALQDHRRAVLVGEPSFGKGSVQKVFELPDGESALKITTARYYTPSGRSIHRDSKGQGGLVPDVYAPMTVGERREMYQRQRDDAVVQAPGEPPRPRFIDPQLARALEILRGIPVPVPLAEDAGG